MTYMPIFVLVVFGILGDVEGIPLPPKRTRGSPRRRIIIARPFKKNIDVTRFSHRLIIREEVYKIRSDKQKRREFILKRILKS